MSFEVSYDTKEFEVEPAFDARGRLTPECAQRICKIIDDQGFVVVPNLLSAEHVAATLRVVREVAADPKHETGKFASETDIKYKRRDFFPLPSTDGVLSLAATVCQRLETVLVEYCGKTRPIFEISMLTSYPGSSHQYIHRDPYGVLCLFAALDDVSPEQGGTVFVPGTHTYGGMEMRHDGQAHRLMRLFRTSVNWRILRHNLTKLWRLYKAGEPRITREELRDRSFSRVYDNHQPNLMRFLAGKNPVFNIKMFGPRTLLALMRNRKSIESTYRLVQAAPKKGTVILYRSDMFHAGPDNRATKPREFFSISISRDHAFQWETYGYSPHSTLLAAPKTLGDLLEMKTA